VETLVATLQLMTDPASTLTGAPLPVAPPYAGPAELFLAGGAFRMGTDEPWAYDNERPAHDVTVAPFFIDAIAVTNRAYLAFMADGGYTRRELWSAEGWVHAQAESLAHPLFWKRENGRWYRRRFGTLEPVPPEEPVQHVCFYEAEAYCRWSGRRLPTEAEWEFAARGASPLPPWSNLDGVHTQPRPASDAFAGASSAGVLQMLGDVWEWTSSDFLPYPGFVSFPYREYSEVFFGDRYKVLRGGAWGVAPVAIRTTFRNWDFPIRRQIFTGFRTARTA
jgi:iron(II)-dependent oxidoreductase